MGKGNKACKEHKEVADHLTVPQVETTDFQPYKADKAE